MIQVSGIDFAAPPMEYTTWFLEAARKGCVSVTGDNPYSVPDERRPYLLSLVRHPFLFLSEVYCTHRFMPINNNLPLKQIISLIEPGFNVLDFIRAVTNHPGAVEKIFGVYQASSVLKCEDLPWAAIHCLRLNRSRVLEHRTPVADRVIGSQHLRDSLRSSEKGIYERYDYR